MKNSAQGLKRIWIAGGLAVIVIVTGVIWILSSRGPATGPATNPVVLRLGYRVTALADITPIILKERGLLKRKNIIIEPVPIASPAVALQQLDGGGIDAMAGLTLEPILQRLASGTAGFHAYYVQVDLPDHGWVSIISGYHSGVTRLADLRSRTVGSLPTDQARFLLRQSLKAAGIPDDKIKISDYNPATPLAGFESGDQFGIFGLEPALSRAEAKGSKRLVRGPISTLIFNGQAIPLSASVISDRFVASHPESYQELVDATSEAVAIQESQTTQVQALFALPAYGGLSQNEYRLLEFPPMRPVDAPEVIPGLNLFIKWLRENSLLKNDVDGRKLFR
jgi:ABC-type nitrate/sulfonate/bicarbonate transport system substrate-binding protein